MGVTFETVSRWETGAKRMGLPADRFLRLLVVMELKIECPTLEQVGAAPARNLAVCLAWNGVEWVASDSRAHQGQPPNR